MQYSVLHDRFPENVVPLFPERDIPDQTPAAPEENAIRHYIGKRAKSRWNTKGPDPAFMRLQDGMWDFLLDRYFRVETTGWENLPKSPSLLVGIHSGTWLTMDAWTLCAAFWKRFGQERILHGTAHDALMALPGLGSYFRKVGVVPAARESVSACLEAGHDVVVWPGGEVDAMRSWKKRDKVVFGGRKGFIRQAMRSGVPIVPVATIGGADTVFVLSEGRFLAKILRGKKLMRSEVCPLVLGAPFGLFLEVLPMHIPLPSKIRTKILPPILVDQGREDDVEYVDQIYRTVESRIQEAVNDLARQRRFPVFG